MTNKDKKNKNEEVELVSAPRGVQRIKNCEVPQVYSELGPELSATAKLGWTDVNMDTGELLQTLPTAMHPIPQVGVVDKPVEVGEPLFIPLSKPSDLKARIMAIVGAKNLSEVFTPIEDDVDDEEAFNRFASEDTNEVDEFNASMDKLPSFCDENGVSNFEKQMKLKSEEANQLRDYMVQMKDPRIQEFLSLSEEKQQEVLNALKVQVPPTNNDGEE